MRGIGGLIAVVVLALLFNLPFAHLTWLGHRLDQNGVETTGTVVRTHAPSSRAETQQYLVTYRFDRTLDPAQREWQVDMTREAFDDAERTGVVTVRVLPDELAVSEVEGQRTSHLPLILTVVGDAFLLAFAILLWRRRRTGEGGLELVALGDLERARPAEEGLQQDEGGVYTVTGEVVAIQDDEVGLQVGERVVRVDLAGHHNPIGYQQHARVRARLPD